MSPAPLPAGLAPVTLLLSILLAAAAVGVGLDVARRVRGAEPALLAPWCLGGALALGTGLWVADAVGRLALQGVWGDLARWAPHPAVVWLAAVLAVLATLAACVAPATNATNATTAGRWRPGPAWAAPAMAAAAVAAGLAAMQLAGLAVAAVLPDAGAGAPPGQPERWLMVAAALLLPGLVRCASRLEDCLRARPRALHASLQAAHDQLQRAVLYDPLTSLPNWRLLFERLDAVTRHCDRAGGQAALLLVDLDGFKPLNDLFGHGFGDAVLCEVAHRLTAVARRQDTVAHLGGDEFVILLADIGEPAAVHQAAMRAVTALQAPLTLARRDARLSASVGIALYPADGDVNKQLAAADAAMYAAKRGGGGQAVFFASQMEAETRAQMALQRDLRLANDQPERGELSLHYQPKVTARDGQITGVEALLRWRHPERGMVGPAEFIPLAERFGLIDRLGAWVIEQACGQVRAWDRQGLRLRVAVNLSMHQLRQPGLADRVQAALARHGVAPQQLMFEITESVAMDDNDATARVLDALAALGTELSIDDFGTGYSSLAYLRRLPSRQLKIDRSFVMDIDTCSDALAIVEAVIRLAHALGLAVVAEGVETAPQRDLLCQLQCDELQGYLFARPVPGETVQRWALGVDRPALLHFGAALPGVARDTVDAALA